LIWGEKSRRQVWGRVCPVAMPSFADKYWTRMAIAFDHNSTHSKL